MYGMCTPYRGMTLISRFWKDAVLDPARYFRVKVLDPAVRPVKTWTPPIRLKLPAWFPSREAIQASLAATEDAPDTATLVHVRLLFVLFAMPAANRTMAIVPVVVVRAGPGV